MAINDFIATNWNPGPDPNGLQPAPGKSTQPQPTATPAPAPAPAPVPAPPRSGPQQQFMATTNAPSQPPPERPTSTSHPEAQLGEVGDTDVTGVQREQEFVSTVAPVQETQSSTETRADMGADGQYAGKTVGYESSLAESSQLGTDLSQTQSFIPQMPADMPQATQWEVTEDQLVENRFASVMDSDNPAFQVVQEAIRRKHAASGQANSAMADRAAVMAVAEVGFQIAAADAATFARSAEFNAAMSNQFGLAQQAFMHQALLSEQNFRQGVMMLREDHLAQVEMANAQLEANAQLMGMEASINLQMERVKQQNVLAQMDRAHNQNLSAMDAQMQFDWNRAEQNQRMSLEQMSAQGRLDQGMAVLNAQNQLAINDRAHTNSLDSMQAQFEYNWMAADQQQYQALERMDRETSNELYRAEAQAGWQAQLNYMSEMGQNARMLLGAMGDIGANPNITAAQARAAMNDVLRQYNAVNEQLASVYSMPPGGTAATNYLYFSGANNQPNQGGQSPTIPFYGGQGGTPTPTNPNPAPTNATAPPPPAPPGPPPVSTGEPPPTQIPPGGNPPGSGVTPLDPIATPPASTPRNNMPGWKKPPSMSGLDDNAKYAQ